jgi:PRC-barrel domain
MLRVASALKGIEIEAKDGRLGSAADFLFDDHTWKIRWLVVDTGTWISDRKVLIHPSAIKLLDEAGDLLTCDLTRAQIEASPGIANHEPVSAQMEHHLYDYYGWNPMWGASMFGGGAIATPLSSPPYFGGLGQGAGSAVAEEMAARDANREADPHLRSIAQVKGYNILASDGAIGHLQDFLVDDAAWEIRYLIVDTKNWWPGKHVLVSPFAVREISFKTREVQLDVTREKVKGSPPWDPADEPDIAYERRLHSHYGWPGYGF